MMIPDFSTSLTNNFPDQTSNRESIEERSLACPSFFDKDPSLQSFTGLPYTTEEISREDVPGQTVDLYKVVERSALRDVPIVDIVAYRAHVLQQIQDLYDPLDESDPTWKEFFEYSLRNRRSVNGSPTVPEAMFQDVEQKAKFPRVGQALRVHLLATRNMTDEQMSAEWHDPQYNEEMRYLQRVSQVLQVFCSYHMKNTPGKFLEPAPAGWLNGKSA